MSFITWGRRQRSWTDIAHDSQTPYMIGRLLGANEMAVALLQREDNETAKRVADVLRRIGGYFLTDTKVDPWEDNLDVQR